MPASHDHRSNATSRRERQAGRSAAARERLEAEFTIESSARRMVALYERVARHDRSTAPDGAR